MIKDMNNDNNDLGGFTIAEWKSKREILKDQDEYSNDWEMAISWFKQRLNRRYFQPMEDISSKITGVGFTIVSIQCILIEHMASMRQGKIHDQSVDAKNPVPSYNYKLSSTHFKDFLEKSTLFSEYFSKQNGNIQIFNSSDFYTNVRCALLHEACTKNDWRINTLSCGYPNAEKKILKEANGIKRIFRDVLGEELKLYINEYCNELKTDKKLRLYFARKMDSLCEIGGDPNYYNWWIDQ